MQTEEPLINDNFLLQKYPGKGGWTYAILPEGVRKSKTPFGWIQVRGFVDSFELRSYRLMPLSSGKLFLPVRAEIRKKIAKQAGDWVHIILYADGQPVDTTEELMLCLEDSKPALSSFLTCSHTERKTFVDYIDSAKNEEMRLTRIAYCLDMLERDQKLPD